MRRRKRFRWRLASTLMLLFAATQNPAQSKEVTYYYTDPQGTVLATTDAQGNVLTTAERKPYGRQIQGEPQSGPGYAGHVDDPDSGLVYMQARYYDSVIGRFLSTDPKEPEPGNAVTLGRYTYGLDNPISNIDPDGREAACVSQASHCRNIGEGIGDIPGQAANALDTVNNDVITPIIAANPAAFGEASVALRGMSAGLRALSAGETAAVVIEGSEVPTAVSNAEQATAQLSELRSTHAVTMSNKALGERINLLLI